MQGYMPVFLQPAASQQQPAQQESVLQPAPVDPAVKKLKDAKANVAAYQKRIKCTSITMIVLGVIGMVYSIYCSFNAKHHAMMLINFPHHHHHGGRHGPPPPPPGELEKQAPKYVSRDEFEVYDTIKTLSMLSFFLFGKIMALGKCGKWMIWRNKSAVTGRLLKKSCLGFVLIILVSMWCAKEGRHIMEVVKKHNPHPQPKEMDWPPMEEGEVFSADKGRHLKEMPIKKKGEIPMAFIGDDEDDCHALASDNACNAQSSKCSWCISAAVKPACHSIENAQKLPAAVFQCSNIEAEKKKEIVVEEKPVNPLKDEEEICHANGDEGSCNAASSPTCSWCTSGAVKAACHSVSNAKRLPAAVFMCSHIDQEDPFKMMDQMVNQVQERFSEFKEKIPKIFDLADDEDDCHALPSDDSCNQQSDKCSWCISAAVKPSCHSIENAKKLPSAVFQCSNIDKFDFFRGPDGDYEEEEEPMFQGIIDRLRGGRRHHRGPPPPPEDEDEDDEQDRSWFGRRWNHHKRGHHGRRHHRGPRVEAENENDVEIIAGTPVKASAAKKFYGSADLDDDMEGPRPYGRHGKHGKHHKGAKCCRLMKLIMAVFFGAHFWWIKKLKTAQEAVEKLTGASSDGWGDWKKKCQWKKEKKTAVVQQQVPVQPVQQVYFQQPIVEYSAVHTESSINSEAPELYEERDKEMGYTFAPAPVASTITVNNTMV